MGGALQRFATDTTCNDTGNPMANPTTRSKSQPTLCLRETA
jgi:hypothetical protein